MLIVNQGITAMSRLVTAVSLAVCILPALATESVAMDSMVTVPSAHTARASIDRLETLAKARGLNIFARIDHAAGARSVGETLRPTELLILGHPKGGTPLMQCAQTYAIDLPMRVLAWEDETGQHWLGYKRPALSGKTQSVPACEEPLKKLTRAIDTLVQEAAR
jgi:uncharacterized protein (DUF302 family)